MGIYKHETGLFGIKFPEEFLKFGEKIKHEARLKFVAELSATEPKSIHLVVEGHLKYFLRKSGKLPEFLEEMDEVKKQISSLSKEQENAFLTCVEQYDVKLPLAKKTAKKDDGGQTNHTHILRLYYSKQCKPLNKQQVESLAESNPSLSKISLLKKWKALKGEQYLHNGNVNNVKEFINSYKILMSEFEPVNKQAFNDVKNHYEQLKETYPDLAY